MPWQPLDRGAWRTTPSWNKVCWLNKLGCFRQRQAFVKLSSTSLSGAEVAFYGEQSALLKLQLTSQPWDTHQGSVRSQNSWCRESQELQESCYDQCPGGQVTEKWCHRGTMGHPQEPQTGHVHGGSHGRQQHCCCSPGYWRIPWHEDTAHQDCSVSVHQGWPDQPYEPWTFRDASQAGSMSEAVNDKVRPDMTT